ncbi:MAG: hypothetical protein J0H89_10675 [Rhizobiales bacterium]|nr:hypothetical protein [Hyphomicrobiales bacterium]
MWEEIQKYARRHKAYIAARHEEIRQLHAEATDWWKFVIRASIFCVFFAFLSIAFYAVRLAVHRDFGFFDFILTVLAAGAFTIFYFFPRTPGPAPLAAPNPDEGYWPQVEARLWTTIRDYHLPIPSPEVWAALKKFVESQSGTGTFTISAEKQRPPQWRRRHEILVDALSKSLSAFLRHYPAQTDGPLTVPFYKTGEVSRVLYEMLEPFRHFDAKAVDAGWWLRDKFDERALKATQEDSKWKGPGLKYPQNFTDTQEIYRRFIDGLSIEDLFQLPVALPIPDEVRFEHTWIIANSGHGKTQTIQHLVFNDIQRDHCGVVVFDPMDALIDKLLELKEFAPGGKLHDRLVLIDPDTFVPAFNPFKLNEREPAQMLALYRYMFGSLLDSPMTDNQATLFDNCALLLRHIPDATFMDLYRLLRGEDYSAHYHKLDDIGREFFQKDFNTKGVDGYEGTRKQVLRRLNAVMRTYPFSVMLQEKENRFSFSGINTGKIYLVKNSIARLTEGGSRLFARFFLVLLSSEISRRKARGELPCFVYLDEADHYVKSDDIVKSLLARARQKSVGLIVAHRTMEEIGNLAPSLEGIASVIYAGGLRQPDLGHMARVMDCSEGLLKGPKGTFGLYLRGKGTSQIRIPFGTLDKQPKMTMSELQALKEEQKAQYGTQMKAPVDVIPLEDATEE